MKKSMPAASPDAYVEALDGWRRDLVEALRTSVRAGSALHEAIKWGHLVYHENGPVLLIRAEQERSGECAHRQSIETKIGLIKLSTLAEDTVCANDELDGIAFEECQVDIFGLRLDLAFEVRL